jgi:hypothetical protein
MEPSSDDRSAVEIQRLREALNLAPEQVDISALVPIFVPGAFCALGNWPGPYSLLRAKDLGLTWSVVLPNQTMRYVDRRLEEHWDSRGIQWKTLALKNLSDITMKIGTHEFRREDGTIYAVAMMHADGIGPSRLLLRDRLASLFPEGYKVAMPEMSCGLAHSNRISEPEMAKIQDTVNHCYKNGIRPLVPGIYSPEELFEAVR